MDRVFHQLTVVMASTCLSVIAFSLCFYSTGENPFANSSIQRNEITENILR